MCHHRNLTPPLSKIHFSAQEIYMQNNQAPATASRVLELDANTLSLVLGGLDVCAFDGRLARFGARFRYFSIPFQSFAE